MIIAHTNESDKYLDDIISHKNRPITSSKRYLASHRELQ